MVKEAYCRLLVGLRPGLHGLGWAGCQPSQIPFLLHQTQEFRHQPPSLGIYLTQPPLSGLQVSPGCQTPKNKNMRSEQRSLGAYNVERSSYPKMANCPLFSLLSLFMSLGSRQKVSGEWAGLRGRVGPLEF